MYYILLFIIVKTLMVKCYIKDSPKNFTKLLFLYLKILFI